MVAIMHTTVTCQTPRCAFHHTHDVRMRERYQCILLLMDGQSCRESVYILNRAASPFFARWAKSFEGRVAQFFTSLSN
jgi:hypothetical protein